MIDPAAATRTAATILVVDDNAASRYSTSRLLRGAGFVTLEAATGREALEMAERGPDAIVLDVNLPDIDGFRVCKILRSRPENGWTPIIHLSASFVDGADRVYGLDSGADGYLTHPVEPPVLVATLNAFIRARSAEDQLRRSEEKFRSVFSHAINGIALLDEALIFQEINAAMAQLIGRPVDSIIGTCCLDYVPAEHRVAAEASWQRWRHDGAGTGIYPLARDVGGPIELDWNISRHTGPGIWLAVVTDVTERRALESQREQLLQAERAARGEAERASRLKDEFLATVSHELRSPLQAILGGVQILRLRQLAGAALDTVPLDIIDRNAKRQAQLIADLLDVARITSGKLRLEFETVDLAGLVNEACDAIAPAAAAKSITMVREIDAGNGFQVRCDPFRVNQVLQNLLTNAVKFTPSGGRISVALRGDGLEAELSVDDSGQGIRSDFLPHIFDTFRQEDGGTARFHGGLGLGLAIVKRLAELHSGSIVARSAGEGHGATFTLRLPRLDATTSRSGLAPPSSPRRTIDRTVLSGLKALVVDDDPDARLVVGRMLGEHGVVVFEASNASEALAGIGELTPDILISDISMPGDDGYRLIRQIRDSGVSAQQLPAIALTAFARPEDRLNVTESGFQAHLSKPVDLDALLGTISTLASPTIWTPVPPAQQG